MRLGPVRLAVVLLGDRLSGAVVQQNRVDTFVIDAETPAAALRAELDARGLAPRSVSVGLARTVVVVKPIDLPPVVGKLREMVRFELDRHLPFPADDAPFDFLPLPPDGEVGQPTSETKRVLIAAADRRVVDTALRLAEEAKLRPVSITVAAHDLLAGRGAAPRRDHGGTAWRARARRRRRLRPGHSTAGPDPARAASAAAHPPAVGHGGSARGVRRPVDRRAAGPGLPRAPPARDAERGDRAHRLRGPECRAHRRGARAQAPAPRRRPEHRGECDQTPAPAPRADRDPARRCLAHDALLGCQGRRVDRPGGAGERADPAPRELAPARARRVRVTRHARPRQRAVPYSRRVGGPAAGSSARSRRPRRPTGARVPGGDPPQARRGGRGATGARGNPPPAAAGCRHTTARPPRSPPSVMANLSRRERTIIAAGLLVGILLGGWSFVVEPILESNRRVGELVPAREQIGRAHG